jgi:hypothetical protein
MPAQLQEPDAQPVGWRRVETCQAWAQRIEDFLHGRGGPMEHSTGDLQVLLVGRLLTRDARDNPIRQRIDRARRAAYVRLERRTRGRFMVTRRVGRTPTWSMEVSG